MASEIAPPWSKLQESLQKILTDSGGVNNALSNPSVQFLPHFLAETSAVSARERLGVYCDAYFLRILESLGSDFPTLKEFLGDKNFRHLIADYLKDHPSRFKNISLIGERLPKFVSRHPLNRKFGFLADLSRLEWEVLSCLYRDRLSPLNLESLRQIPEKSWPKARFILDPSVRFIELDWDVDRLWNERMLARAKKRSLKIKKSERSLLIVRDHQWVQVRALGLEESTALKRLRGGASLGNLCDFLENSRKFQVKPGAIQVWIRDWISSGVLKRLVFP